MSRFSLRGRPRKLKKSALRAKGAAAAARRLGVRVVEHEPLADHVRVVVEHRAVEIQQALLVDVDLRAVGSFEDFVAKPRLLLPRERVAQPRASAALHADAQSAVVDAQLGHQRADLAGCGFADLNHFLLCGGAPPPPPVAARLSARRGTTQRLSTITGPMPWGVATSHQYSLRPSAFSFRRR